MTTGQSVEELAATVAEQRQLITALEQRVETLSKVLEKHGRHNRLMSDAVGELQRQTGLIARQTGISGQGPNRDRPGGG